ncbi:hypothetical protein M422DRAFT_255525 [Sphaerobolus stellatus SS14]|uniref:Uncharacterized protein n=1 Tax=Sphaerobolus stellatus (strain SS14) TaxID=990650 RepID=A0A0C9V2W8_SPHS4|nr:hypothetical protein M422DRAFT_255525 [Sphaerobolus stellatus SS14]
MSPRYPKVVALDLDFVIFTSYFDDKKFGNHGWVNGDLRDNLQLIDPHTIQDKKNHANKLHMGKDIPKIIHDLVMRNVEIAIVSQHPNKDL